MDDKADTTRIELSKEDGGLRFPTHRFFGDVRFVEEDGVVRVYAAPKSPNERYPAVAGAFDYDTKTAQLLGEEGFVHHVTRCMERIDKEAFANLPVNEGMTALLTIVRDMIAKEVDLGIVGRDLLGRWRYRPDDDPTCEQS